MTFGSLFAGIGGLDLGLERAGMECRWQVEINDYAQRVLAKHWPNVRRHNDIRTWPAGDTERVDLICGGFPCQDISNAGKGEGLDGDRSGLFFEAVRVVRQLRPRYVLLENVAALLTRGLDRVHGAMAKIGYDSEWHCIPACAVGAPHIRDRVFILAHAASIRMERCRADWQQVTPISIGEKILGRDSPICRGGNWETEPAVGRVANGVPARVDRLKCLGNAVVPQVAEYIGRQIIGDGRT